MSDVLERLGSFIDGEVVVKLVDGWTIRSGSETLTSGDYVRLCDENGEEYLYYDQAEWEEDPAVVMGAFINAAAGLRVREKVECAESPNGYHWR